MCWEKIMGTATVNEAPLLNAATLVLTPKEEFKTWLKQTALKQQIFPAKVEHDVTQEVLDNHALAFITPMMISKVDAENFYTKNDKHIFDLMLATWPFPLNAWPQERSHQKLVELFDAHYYLYLINLTDKQNGSDNTETSVTTIKPKAPVKEWLEHLMEEKKVDLPNIQHINLGSLRKFGIALLTPFFKNQKEETKFFEKHVATLFSMGLSLYCNDSTLWPTDLSYEAFQQWFDCINYYPAINLMREVK